MGGIAKVIAEVLILPSILVAVGGYVLMVQALSRVVAESNRHATYPWASRSTIWIFMLGGFGDVARAATGTDKTEWQRAALGRLLLVLGLAAFLSASLMWQLKDRL